MKNYILLAFILLFSLNLFSQVLSINNSEVAVSKGAILCATGSVENSGTIQNSGTLAVAGDWKNNLTYTDKNGIFILNGSEVQDVFQDGQLFGILIIDGGGRKMFSSDANVKDSLILKNGIVEIPEGFTFKLEKTAAATIGSDITHIDGILYNTGEGYKLYPVGTEGVYAPAELSNIINDEAIIGIKAVNYNPFVEFSSDLASVSTERYWNVTELNDQDFTANISLSYDNDYRPEEIENILVAQAENAEGVYTGIGKSETDKPVNITGITSKNTITQPYFALAFVRTEGNKYYIPNTFSPRASAEKDKCLRIYGNYFSAQEFKFMVFNKWGNKVFESNSLDDMKKKGWDGKNPKTGRIEEFGMYSFVIKGKTLDGKYEEYSNTVLVLK